MERARQVDPDLTIDGASGAMLDRLVQRLDGMPLVIEPAAARVEVLGLAQLLDRPDDRLQQGELAFGLRAVLPQVTPGGEVV
jgi:predicted ATPase